MFTKLQKITILFVLIIGIYIPSAYCAMEYLDLETMWNECDIAIKGTVNNINNSDLGWYRIVEIEVETYYIRQSEEAAVKLTH